MVPMATMATFTTIHLAAGSIDSFTGKFKDNLGRHGTFSFTFDTNDTKPT